MKDEKNKDEEDDVEINADAVYVTSVLLGQVAIWLLVILLAYSEFTLWRASLSQNFFKMIIVAIIMGGLVGLSIFLFKRGKKRVSNMNKQR